MIRQLLVSHVGSIVAPSYANIDRHEPRYEERKPSEDANQYIQAGR